MSVDHAMFFLLACFVVGYSLGMTGMSLTLDRGGQRRGERVMTAGLVVMMLGFAPLLWLTGIYVWSLR